MVHDVVFKPSDIKLKTQISNVVEAMFCVGGKCHERPFKFVAQTVYEPQKREILTVETNSDRLKFGIKQFDRGQIPTVKR